MTSSSEPKPRRTRFAPSPTGSLHLGGLRTALFSYLLAKKTNGSFYLRIEDTDRQRLQENSVDGIVSSLKWAGLPWDGTIIYQSERRSHYKKYADQLLSSQQGYRCFCSKERLLALRSKSEGKSSAERGYDRKCRNLSPAEIQQHLDDNTPYAIRLKIPLEGQVTLQDQILGEIKHSWDQLDDAIVLKSDGYPTYHLAHVVDDGLMGITDVLRGQEWLSTWPMHHRLWEIFSFPQPRYLHLPLILGEHGGKLSKRKGSMSVADYRTRGYLPEALINYLALLGWSYDDKTTLFSLAELETLFSIKGLSKSNAMFSSAKLNHLNNHYIQQLAPHHFLKKAKSFLPDTGLDSHSVEQASLLYQSRLQTLSELASYLAFLQHKKIEYRHDELLQSTRWTKTELLERLKIAHALFEPLEIWTKNSLTQGIKAELKSSGKKFKMFDVLMPTRMAVTGLSESPSILDLIVFLGKTQTLKRLSDLRDALDS